LKEDARKNNRILQKNKNSNSSSSLNKSEDLKIDMENLSEEQKLLAIKKENRKRICAK